MTPSCAPYGLWSGPITAASLAEDTISFAEVLTDRTDGSLYHVEGRPAENGCNVLVDSRTGQTITPTGQNTRTRVHEYGGGAAAVHRGRAVLSDVGTGLAYELARSGDVWSEARRIVPDNPALRYADFAAHPIDSDLTLAVCEDHTIDEPAAVANSIVLIRSATQTVTQLASGADFYAAPRWSSDGSHICWTQWMHPNMPWESSTLWVAQLESDGSLVDGSATQIAGSNDGSESISQPRWAIDSLRVLFLSDASGYYNLQSWSVAAPVVETLISAKVDLGSPDWVLNQSTFQPLTADCVIVRTTPSELSLLSLSDGSLRRLTTPPDHLFSHIRVASSNLVLCVVSGLTSAARLVTFNPQAEEIRFETLKLTSKHSVDDGYISKPREIAFQAGPDPGQANSVEAYAWLYEPANKDHEGPEGAKPPLIIKCHGALRCYPPEDLVKGRIGGPTTSSSPALDWTTQFWTSRGFMLADVNYGGSTGKGRAYRDRLRGNWGIVDVEDSAACVRHLVKEGLVDPKRVLIMGRSAGGFTVLASLVGHSDLYAAGASTCGIASLTALAEHTHKFESQYLFRLVGGTPSEISSIYRERAPLTHADRITSALIVLQGSEDPIVPVGQAEAIVAAVKARGARCEYALFEGEGHSFRKAESVKAAAERTLAFFVDVLGLETHS